MKLTNYKMGYNFDCSIHGTITMTKKEFEKARNYLINLDEETLGWNSCLLLEDLQRTQPIKNGFLLNVRVTATELLVKKYKLAKYKKGNYQIKVIN